MLQVVLGFKCAPIGLYVALCQTLSHINC